MKKQTLTPSPKYLTRMRLLIILAALLFLLSGALLAFLIGLDEEAGGDAALIVFLVTAGLDVLWILPALILSGPYYRSLSYEIQDDEVIVRVGIWTHSVKHVPYRTVTNITVKRDILDRWLGIGTLNIQTAGMSGTTGAEESLVGLVDVQSAYDTVVTQLRRFRGAMSPVSAGEEIGPPASQDATMRAILEQVEAIRELMEARR